MEYVINVARWTNRNWNGGYVHYFKVTVPYGQVKEVYEQLKEKFPEPEYKLDVTMWEKVGKSVDMENFNH